MSLDDDGPPVGGWSALDMGDDPVFTTAFDPDGERSLTETLVDAVAAVNGVEPMNLPPLHDAVDADALEALFDRPSGDGGDTGGLSLRFAYGGVLVRVRGGGEITIYPRDAV